MAQPTASDLHVDALLTDLSLMYTQEEDAFVHQRVFPNIPVQKQSDRYAVFSRADFNRNLMRLRAPGTESAGGGWRVDTTPTYYAPVWALHKDIDDQQRANADFVFNLDAESTRFLTMQALLSKEVAWASAFFINGIWGQDWSGVAASPTLGSTILQWNDPNSNPIIDIRNLKRYAQLTGLYRANKMVIGRPVFDTLVDHPDFIDRIKYGQTPGKPALATKQILAELFELDEVLVMDAIVNNGVEGAGPDSGGTSINALESNAFIGNKNVLLVYTPSAPGINTPGCGYTFSWTGFMGANAIGGRIKNFLIPQISSQRTEIELAYAFKLATKELGGFILNAIA